MHTVPANTFKTKCLKIVDAVANTHEPIIITKRGIPVAKIIPIKAERDPFGCMAGTVMIHGDIVSSDHKEQWDAED